MMLTKEIVLCLNHEARLMIKKVELNFTFFIAIFQKTLKNYDFI